MPISTAELRRLKEEKLRRLLAKRQTISAEQQAEWDRCALDPVYFINEYCWTYDPRLTGDKWIRFKLFPMQVDFVRWIQERERNQSNGLVEKSRDCGASYVTVAYAIHGWLFRNGFSAGYGSRKEDLVDKIGDPDSLFEKIRIMLSRLPGWMLPAGFAIDKHCSHMKVVNPATGSTLTGEAGKNLGRGGRKSIYFVDESAFLEQPELAERSLSDTTNVRIDISTPFGPGNPFAVKRHSGKVKVFIFDWKDDPRKNRWVVVPKGWTPRLDGNEKLILPDSEIQSRGQLPQKADVAEGFKQIFPWYEHYKLTHDPVTVAQEVDRDYNASIEGICIPAKWVRAAVEFAIPGVSGSYPLVAGFDPADGGKNKSVLIARRGPFVLDPLAWGELSAGQAAHTARGEAERLGVQTVFYDAIGSGTSVHDAWNLAENKPKFEPVAVKWGDQPTNSRWPSGKTSAEMFMNLRAELWWILRTRFEKTWQVVNEDASFPPDELISIPNCPELIAQLSTPLIVYTDTGKIKLESKQDMSKRGVASPDYADSLAYSFAPAPAGMDFF